MTMPFVTEVLVADHEHDLRRRARTAQLARLARCCRPTVWGRAARQAVRTIARLRAGIHDARPAAVCCAGA